VPRRHSTPRRCTRAAGWLRAGPFPADCRSAAFWCFLSKISHVFWHHHEPRAKFAASEPCTSFPFQCRSLPFPIFILQFSLPPPARLDGYRESPGGKPLASVPAHCLLPTFLTTVPSAELVSGEWLVSRPSATPHCLLPTLLTPHSPSPHSWLPSAELVSGGERAILDFRLPILDWMPQPPCRLPTFSSLLTPHSSLLFSSLPPAESAIASFASP
jgi:hypothetical protein